MSGSTNSRRGFAPSAFENITHYYGVREKVMEANILGKQAKKNLIIAGRIAVGKYLLKVACSRYPTPDTVHNAAALRVNDLWQNHKVPLLDAFARVTKELDAEKITVITTEGITVGDGPLQPFKKD